jgi:dihydrofolate synthase/folylpolyglutamate synthase
VHQLGNAATALAVLTCLGVELEHRAVADALRTVTLAGRFQQVSVDSAAGAVEWIFDVAHNVPAASGLAMNLRALPRVRTIAGVVEVGLFVGRADVVIVAGASGVRRM